MVLRAADHHGRFGVANEVFDLCTLVGGVERQEHMAGAQGGEVEHHGFDRFFHLDRDARGGGQLQRIEQVGHHGGGAVEVVPGIRQAVVGLHGGAVEIGGEGVAQGDEQVLVAHGWIG
ncbi:hypothetical protein D9M69_729350 [compost metagenome]